MEIAQNIIIKLGKSTFKRIGNITGITTYVNHEFDEEHILDIIIEGIYKYIFDIWLDG